jgi:hypothetical protein
LFLIVFDIWTGAEAAGPAHECRRGIGLIHSANQAAKEIWTLISYSTIINQNADLNLLFFPLIQTY